MKKMLWYISSMERHFTATALVIDQERNCALLLWHKRLQRWMPPGGHMDPDEIPDEAAAREVSPHPLQSGEYLLATEPAESSAPPALAGAHRTSH